MVLYSNLPLGYFLVEIKCILSCGKKTEPLLFRETYKEANPEWVKVSRNTVFLTFSVDAPLFVDFCRPAPHSLIFCLLRFTCGNQELKSSLNVMQSVMAHGLVALSETLVISMSLAVDFSFLVLKQVSLLHFLLVSFSLFLTPKCISLSLLHFSFTHRVVSTPYLKIRALERIWLVFSSKELLFLSMW